MLTLLDVGEASASQRSADGVPLCLARGAALYFRGRLVASHLGSVEGSLVGTVLAHKHMLGTCVDSPAASFHLPLWTFESVVDRYVVPLLWCTCLRDARD